MNRTADSRQEPIMRLEGKPRIALAKLMQWSEVPVRVRGPIHPSTARVLVAAGLATIQKRMVSTINRKKIAFASITETGVRVANENGIWKKGDTIELDLAASRLRYALQEAGIPTVLR